MSGTDLHQLLMNRAGDAPLPPADLMERVEAGYRRRRRGQVALSAFTAVLVLAVAAWAGLSPALHRTSLPAARVDLPPLHLPLRLDQGPGITSAFPESVVDGIPATTPSNLNGAVYGRLGLGHALIADPNTLYDYDTGSRTFRKITETGSHLTAIAIAPHWIVWQQTDSTNAGHFFVYRVPISGGQRELVTTVNQGPRTSTWYATDDHVFWTSKPGVSTGVTRLSLNDGAIVAMAGFGDLSVDGTPWAKAYDIPTMDYPGTGIQTFSRTTMMRNVVTGERRPVSTRADTEWLRCVATFCLGQTRSAKPSPTMVSGQPYHSLDGYFVQHPDGSDRIELTYPLASVELVRTKNSGMLVFRTGLLVPVVDPVSGKIGIIPNTSDFLRCTGITVLGVEWSISTDPGKQDCHPGGHYAIFD